MSEAELATARVRQLIELTRRLSERLSAETSAFRENRPHDVAASLTETQEMANLYRRDTAHVKANPALLAGAPFNERKTLIDVTRTFDQILGAHAMAVEAARKISEGLVRTIAEEITLSRTPAAAYGSSGRAAQADGRAIALNRTA